MSPKQLPKLARQLFHLSTDYVFFREEPSRYDEDSVTNPRTVYRFRQLKDEVLVSR